MKDDRTDIIDRIEASNASPQVKAFCIMLMRDAISRKVEGDFNLYGALSSLMDDDRWSRLYRNPTNDKHAFVPVMQILAAVTGARMSGLVSEGWHLDTSRKSEREMRRLQRRFDREGFSISGHPESRECIFVTVETDEEVLVANVSLPIEEGKTIMVMSSNDDDGTGMEGEMTGLRPTPETRLRVLSAGRATAVDITEELEIDWITHN